MFRFLESQDDEDKRGTTFVQAGDFSGMLKVVLSKWWPGWLGGMRGKVEGRF
jgi:hypothetical protein